VVRVHPRRRNRPMRYHISPRRARDGTAMRRYAETYRSLRTAKPGPKDAPNGD
jgi:hypothetical protein